MTTISNGESGLIVRNKLNDIWAGLELNAYDTSIAATAVDVFVYDTSKDSDGGAWRKRTQHTSWYNETLNTATRGARREFPAVAVIVAETNKVTIYDADDPSLPMWRVEDYTGLTIRAAVAINGQVWIGASTGVIASDYAGDDLGSTTLDYTTSTTPAIVNNSVNDIAATVLPDAPIDHATGLPVPTIAVATDGGVSVIADNGNVYDNTAGGLIPAARVFWDADNRLHANRRASSPNYYISKATNIAADNWSSDFVFTTSTTPNIGTPATNAGMNMAQADGHATAFAKIGLYGTSDGFGFLHTGTSLTSSMVAYTTSTYNTGWMNGDIKGAFLSDTDDTDLVGSGELVTNGTFDTDTSGWTGRNANTVLAVSSAKLSVSAGAADVAYAYQQITAAAGVPYVLTLDYFDISGSPRVLVGIGTGTSTYYDSGSLSGNGSLTITFTPTSDNPYISLYASSSATSGLESQYDNISVKLADADRSGNNNGLIVNGTITRTAVATGAELVAYSGFSDSNYLEQPYNSDLDFGTGDFCVMGWVNRGTDSWAMLLDRSDGSTANGRLQLDLYPNSTCELQLRVGSASLLTSATSLPANQWVHVAGFRRGNTGYVAINGVIDTNTANLSGATVDDSVAQAAKVRIGSRNSDGQQSLGGSLALWRISATAPTAEQIARIYQDEKVLFQENAQATLYGASDAVTALAHDPVTDLLHVGTSAGRSVFQGLRRVSNTTTAVGTAISASNGLVVEE